MDPFYISLSKIAISVALKQLDSAETYLADTGVSDSNVHRLSSLIRNLNNYNDELGILLTKFQLMVPAKKED